MSSRLAPSARCGRPERDLTADISVFAAALAALNAMAASLSVLWLVLPHPAGADERTILYCALVEYGLGAFLLFSHKPLWLVRLSVAADTLVISVALVATGDAQSVYAFYYLWTTLYAVCFFGARQIAIQTTWVGVAYAGSLAVLGGPPMELITQWLLPMVTLLAAGTLVRQLTGRLRSNEARIRHAAGRDPLTGLANRALFADWLDAALAEPDGDPVAVLFMDLDHFKRVNDSLGHAVGDALLVAVAERLRSEAGPSVSLARFGGDEFLALIRGPHWEAIGARLASAFDRPFDTGDYEFTVKASFGIATARPGDDAETLMSHADTAVYAAKQSGRGRLASFDDSMHAAVSHRLRLENDLRHALENDEIEVAYQPVVELERRSIAGAEAVGRWIHPELGPIAPELFIAVAEEIGLIDVLGERIFTIACHEAGPWVRAIDGFRLCVNLSPRELDSPGLVARLARILEAFGVPATALTLEVTETALVLDDDRTRENLSAIAAAGIGLAIDDFGTGRSSLAQLSRLRFDEIKLDRGFVRGERSELRDAIVAAVARIGSVAGLRVVAEGIETREQSERVRRLGCGFGQGWLFGAPVAAAEFDALLTMAGFDLGFSEQTERRRARQRVLAGVDPELAVDGPDVRLDRVDREVERVGDLAHGSVRKLPQHRELGG
jgi:diguanylate cyclase (GGDEF)-like protein